MTVEITGPCRELIDERLGRLVRCEAPAEGVRLQPPHPARPLVIGGPYCSAHGGIDRARAEAERDWMICAPAAAGDAGAVLNAGVASLRSENVYVVVRALEGGWWTTGLGIGSRYEDLRGTWRSDADAMAFGVQVWHRRLELRMAELLEARGGDLSWGLPIRPLARPLVVELGRSGNAMDEVAAGVAVSAPVDLPAVVDPDDVTEEEVRHPGEITARSKSGLVARWDRVDGAWARTDDDRRVWPAPSKRARGRSAIAVKDPTFREVISAADAEQSRRRHHRSSR